jgi:hypothetical protein
MPGVNVPETGYAKTPDDVYIAYQVTGDGPVDLAWQFDFVGNVDLAWEAPVDALWFTELASFTATDSSRPSRHWSVK